MKLTIALAQINVKVNAIDEQLKKTDTYMAKAKKDGAELIVFPEMWITGLGGTEFITSPETYTDILNHIGALAKKHQLWIFGTMPTPYKGGLANTGVLFNADGEQAAHYHKLHMFTVWDEHKRFIAGDDLGIVETPWGKIGLAICFDLRFPELFRTYALQGVDLILLPSAFPHPRMEHWQTLTKARAIENQLYLATVNQVGFTKTTRHEVDFFGCSSLISPWGETIAHAGEHKESVITTTIDFDLVEEIRQRIPVLGNRRPDVYKLD